MNRKPQGIGPAPAITPPRGPAIMTWLIGLALPLACAVWLLPSASPAFGNEDPRNVALQEFQSVPPFLVRVDVDRPDRVYHGGDTIQVSVRSERAGYLYLFYCDASQNISCLFPNQVQQDNRVPAGETVLVPHAASGFDLRVGPPYGREVLKAVVTTEPLQSLEITALTKGSATPITPRKFKGVFVELREAAAAPVAGTPAAVSGSPGGVSGSPGGVSGSPGGASGSPGGSTGASGEAADRGQRGWAEHDVQLTTVAPQADPPAVPHLAELTTVAELPESAVPDGTAVAGPAAAGGTGRRVGVFIGIRKYQDPSIRPLQVADQDARVMAELLREVGQLTDSVLLVNEQATLENIRRVIQEALPAATRPGDLILLYWSGHGGRTSNLDGNEPDGFDEYLVPYDGQLAPASAIRSSMLLDKTFGRWVQNLDGRKLVVILDACHSGGQSPGAIKAITGGQPEQPFRDFFFQTAWNRAKDIGQRETAVLASSRASQLSFERRGRDLSVMTHFLTERIRTAQGPLTLRDAAAWVQEKVPEFVQREYPGTTQTPIFVDLTTPPVLLRP